MLFQSITRIGYDNVCLLWDTGTITALPSRNSSPWHWHISDLQMTIILSSLFRLPQARVFLLSSHLYVICKTWSTEISSLYFLSFMQGADTTVSMQVYMAKMSQHKTSSNLLLFTCENYFVYWSALSFHLRNEVSATQKLSLAKTPSSGASI